MPADLSSPPNLLQRTHPFLCTLIRATAPWYLMNPPKTRRLWDIGKRILVLLRFPKRPIEPVSHKTQGTGDRPLRL
jgi:hypothetical protein